MRTSTAANWALFLVGGLSTVVSATTTPLATITPCPSCPKTCKPAKITVTSQYQPVSTCVPVKVHSDCTKKDCKMKASCSTYDFVSTVIPCEGGTTSATVTKTDQIVKLSHVSTVLTELSPCPTTTKAPTWNGTFYNMTAPACTVTKYQTMIVDISCPYNEIGPLAMGGYEGSGLCKNCTDEQVGSKSQEVDVWKCLDGVCSGYPETWVSAPPPLPSSTSDASYSSNTFCPTSGAYTIPVTATYTPSASGFEEEETTTFSITTSVSKAQTVALTAPVHVTFTGQPSAASVVSEAPYSSSTYLASAGSYTIPVTTTCTPAESGFTKPVTSTFSITTSVAKPGTVSLTHTLTVTYTAKPTKPTSVSTGSYSSNTYCPSAGTYSIPVTTTVTPSGAGYTKPITSTFTITTSVSKPQTIPVTKSCTFTFTGKPSVPSAPAHSVSPAPISTTKYCTNGPHTIPITKTFTPTGGSYTAPVTTTVYYTTTVTDGPKTVSVTTTVTVTFTTTYCPSTVVSGSTLTPSSTPPSVSATVTPYPTTGSSTMSTAQPSITPYPTGPIDTSVPTGPTDTSMPTGSVYPTGTDSPSGTSYPTSTPTPSPPAEVGDWDFVGCLGSSGGFPSFNVVESSDSMTVDLCTSECSIAGLPYAGLYKTDCLCSATLDATEETNGVCDIPCPGNALQTCGGDLTTSLRRRNYPANRILDIYKNTVVTPTSTSSAPTSDPSSDPDAEPEKRNIHADMEIAQRKARNDSKLRRGGMLRSLQKKESGNVLVKKDFGLKSPLGL